MMTVARKTSKMLAPLADPLGRKRSRSRRRLLRGAAAAVGGAIVAAGLTVFERRRSQAGAASAAPEGAGSSAATPMPARPETSPLDDLAARAERMKVGGDDAPGQSAHLGFGVGGSIPSEPRSREAMPSERQMREAMASEDPGLPTGGGDALWPPIRSRGPVNPGDEIVTGAGEAISNSSMQAASGSGDAGGHNSLH